MKNNESSWVRIILTNLSDQKYLASRQKLNASAKSYGINEILSFNFDDLKNAGFYSEHQEILDLPKGLGYWLWKPYIILEAMKKLAVGDIVIYSDCGIEIIDSLDPLIDISKTKEDILLFGNGNLLNKTWTKRDCFILMDCDNETFWNSLQCDASFIIFRKSEVSMKFLLEWLGYGCDKRVLTDLPNSCGYDNLDGFIEHRWDQSILSVLAERYRLNLYRIPTQFGNHYKMQNIRSKGEYNGINQLDRISVNYYHAIPYYNSNYGQLLNHHREKLNEPDQEKNLLNTTATKNPNFILKQAKKIFNKMLTGFGYQLIKK